MWLTHSYRDATKDDSFPQVREESKERRERENEERKEINGE
jgi:hypothetical protein